MSNPHRRVIAKEIMDETRSHFKKQREQAAAKPDTEPVERKPEPKYEPSANFAKTFSTIMGERTKSSSNVKLIDNPRIKSLSLKTVEQSVQNESRNIKQICDEKLELPQAPQQAVEPGHKEEAPSRSDQPSIFERLSRGDAETTPHEPKEDVKQVSPNEPGEKEKANPNPRMSVFERLSRSDNNS